MHNGMFGETQQRLFLLSAWKETIRFTDEEKALLALTEEVTFIHRNGVTDETYKEAEKYFTPQTIGEIIMSAVLINVWNRIAVSTHKPLGREHLIPHKIAESYFQLIFNHEDEYFEYCKLVKMHSICQFISCQLLTVDIQKGGCPEMIQLPTV